VNEIRKTIYDGFEKMLLGISYIVRSEAKWSHKSFPAETRTRYLSNTSLTP
jgi:hypothetical protein